MIMTAFKDVLAQKPLLGFCSMYASPGIVERIGQAWDWCWIDGQHGEWGAHDIHPRADARHSTLGRCGRKTRPHSGQNPLQSQFDRNYDLNSARNR